VITLFVAGQLVLLGFIVWNWLSPVDLPKAGDPPACVDENPIHVGPGMMVLAALLRTS